MSNPLNTKELMVELQSKGIRLEQCSAKGRQGGAGPANGIGLVFGKNQITIPTTGKQAANSEYTLRIEGKQSFIIKDGQPVSKVDIIGKPQFYNLQTADGVPYNQIALLHGRDCLASTVIQTCSRWHGNERCQFCGIGTSLNDHNTIPVKTPKQLAEVAEAAVRLDGVKHVTLTAGTTANPLYGIKHLGECAWAIKQATGLPIHVQFEPVEDQSVYSRLKECGVDTVGMHIESFDQKVRERIISGKAKVPISVYFDAFKKAVNAFGRNQVSTYVIIGLGENYEETIDGCIRCIEIGVYPFVVPLRPVKGTPFADMSPPEPKTMREIYKQVAKQLAKSGMRSADSKAGCVRCGACSALPAFENTEFLLKIAESEEELKQYYAVRRQVFVNEQGVFTEDDQDEHDPESLPIIGIDMESGRVVGVVRCYPLGNGDWMGGRLAVLPAFRKGLGSLLVRKAMEEVKKRGCSNFYANIQEQNVNYFQRLGWSLTGGTMVLGDLVHYHMQVCFSKVE